MSDTLCPNAGERVPADAPVTLVGGVEYAPCAVCSGAIAPVFHTSEGHWVIRYRTHELREEGEA